VPANKKTITRIILITLTMLILFSTPAVAAVSGFVAKDNGGECYEYAYDDLLDSYALKMLGLSNGLYEDFASKSVYALLNSTGAYIDYKAILDQYAAVLLSGSSFDIGQYTESATAKKAVLPATINQVKVVSGKITHIEKNIGSSTEANPGIDPPKTKTAISGLSTVSVEQAQLWAAGRGAHQRFIDIAPLYWQYGEKTGIRPEVLYAQAAITTSYGRFDSQIPVDANNWAGIKKADGGGESNANFETFASADDGVRAHYNHMAAYLGLDPIGEPHARYVEVVNQSWAGAVIFVEDLSGKWDSSLDYHVHVLTLLDQMYKTKTESREEEPPAESNNPGHSGSSPGSESGDEQTVAVNVDILRLRSGPGTEYDILDRLVRGTVLTVKESQGVWLKVITPDNKNGWVHGEYVVRVGTAVDVFVGKTIVIDPGHGGSDPGAIGITGLREKVVNLAVAQHLVNMLKDAGAKVLVTRSGDQSVSNQQRVDLANDAGADLFISIHANAFSNPESNGTETHYCGKNSSTTASKYLAQQLQRELVPALGLRDRGVKANSFFVLTKTNMPAALVELGFLTNAEEEKLLGEKKTQQAAAEALFRGIEAFLQKYR